MNSKIGWGIRLMLATGMRTQELLGLEPRHIAKDGSSINIEQAVVMRRGSAAIGPTKTADSVRTVPVPEMVRYCAMNLRETERKFVWEVGRLNQPCNPSYFRDKFKQAIGAIEGVRMLTPHCCRHTYITHMGKFNNYAQRMNEIANAAFAEYREKEAAVKSAESRYNAYPRRNGADPAYMAKSTRAEADLAEARNAFEQMRRHLFDDKRREIAAVRAELEKAVGDAFAADPTKVDMQTMELLRSGIMSADEYNRLIDKATANGNPTMARMIAQSAADMAERTKGDADVSRSYRLVSHKGKGMNGQEYLDAFDCLCRTFNRCERNFALSTKWDELTSPIVDSF